MVVHCFDHTNPPRTTVKQAYREGKKPTVQDTFQPITGLFWSYQEMGVLFMQKMQSDGCMTLFVQRVETVSKVVSLRAATSEHNHHALLVKVGKLHHHRCQMFVLFTLFFVKEDELNVAFSVYFHFSYGIVFSKVMCLVILMKQNLQQTKSRWR